MSMIHTTDIESTLDWLADVVEKYYLKLHYGTEIPDALKYSLVISFQETLFNSAMLSKSKLVSDFRAEEIMNVEE